MRNPRQKNNKHLAFIRRLPCLICGNDTQTEAAHIRYGDPTIAKQAAGLGQKPHDMFTVPLCNKHHREQHNFGEQKWWELRAIDPVKTALALYAETGNYERGARIAIAWLSR